MTPDRLEDALQHRFTQPQLLAQALTHRSFGVPHNERLEFLGDSVLNCAVARLIYQTHPEMPEGEMSRLRANLVNQATLADIARELEIGPRLRLGEGEHKTGGAARPSILADAVEALLGAIFIEAGFDRAGAVVATLYEKRIHAGGGAPPVKDAKTALQEWLQARRASLPQYTVVRIEGESHRQTFFVRCEVASEGVVTEGHGASRRIGEQDAAAHALDRILTGQHT